MNNIFYILGLVVVVLFIAGYFGLRWPGASRGTSRYFFSNLSNTGQQFLASQDKF